MRIFHKLFLGFFSIALIVWVFVFSSIYICQKIFLRFIQNDVVLASKILAQEIDHEIHSELRRLKLCGQLPLVQSMLSDSNKTFESMKDRDTFINQKDQDWLADSNATLPLISEVTDNLLSKSLRQKQGFYKEQAGFPVFGEVFITNRFGVNIAATEKTTDYFQSDELWWQETLAHGHYVGDFEFDKSADMYAMTLAVRVDDSKGEPIGVIKAVLNLRSIITLLNEVKMREPRRSATLFLLNEANHAFIYPFEKFGQPVPGSFWNALKGKKDRSVLLESNYFDDWGRVSRIGAYTDVLAPEENYGVRWGLWVSYGTDEVFDAVRTISLFLLTIAGIVTAASLLAAILLAVSFARSLERLEKMVTDFGKGVNISPEIKIAKDEIGHIMSAFQHMADKIRTSTISIQELQAEVARRENVEEKMNRYAAEVTDLYNRAPCGYHSLNEDGVIMRMNETELKWLGYDSGEVIGKKKYLEFLTPESKKRFHRFFPLFKERGWIKDAEIDLIRKDGSVFSILLNSTIIKDNNGHFLMSRSTIFDITERRRLESELRHKMRMEAVGRLAGGIAHDFNNMLTVINGYSGYLINKMSSEDPYYRMVTEIKDAGDCAAAVVKQLMALNQRHPSKPQIISINDMIEKFERIARRLIGENIEFKKNLGKEVGAVMLDPGHMEQILLNLFVNAKEAMPEGGELVVTTENVQLKDPTEEAIFPKGRSGAFVRITVKDTGIGISPGFQKQIFEPFFTTKSKGTNAGLGLSILYRILEQAGGAVSLESALQQGTTFRIYLPQSSEGTKRKEGPDFSKLPRGQGIILLAEDENQVREFALQVLRERGYEVHAVCNGEEVLNILKKVPDKHFDLLLTDVLMPRMSGKELADHVNAVYPKIKIIFMSGYSEYLGGELGEANFLPKPFTPSELSLKVWDVLGR